MRNKETKELVAMKYIERGPRVHSYLSFYGYSEFASFFSFQSEFICFWPVLWQIDENVAREIINHRSLRHPNIIRFKEVRSDVHFSILNFGLENNF